MRFACKLTHAPGSGWEARHEGPDVGAVAAKAESREEAIEKLRGEIRYRLELCPCTGDSYQHIDVDLIEG